MRIQEKKNIIIAEEGVRESWSEFYSMIGDHCEETLHGGCSVDREVLEMLDTAETLRFYTARYNGVAVGYSLFVVDFNLVNKTQKVAKNIGIYLKPSHRKGYTASQLLDYTERRLFAEGVVEIHQSVPEGSKLDVLLSKKGYYSSEVVYCKGFHPLDGE